MTKQEVVDRIANALLGAKIEQIQQIYEMLYSNTTLKYRARVLVEHFEEEEGRRGASTLSENGGENSQSTFRT